MKKRELLFLSVTLVPLVCGACSINKMAVNAVSDALTGEGSSDVFTGDSDPLLVGDALPFAIKMYESLLSGNPGHQGLILTTGSLFVMYANAFVQGPAELLPRAQYAERQAAMERAKRLYLRGADILYGGLEKKYPGFAKGLRSEGFPKILAKMKKADVPSLYWSAAGYLSAYSLNPFDMELGVKIPELMSLANRAYELDPDFNSGALDDFFVLAYASLPESMGGNKSLADTHYQRALEKSGGRLAGPYVSYASAVSIPAQDYDTFKICLETALALDPDADPGNRLVNIISQRKARYFLDNAGLYFIDFDTGEDWGDEDYN
jgi:predicted anti-sigma-YlaC factor YlaD